MGLQAGQILQICPKCGGKAVIGWGKYMRKCLTGSKVEPVPIRRFRCKSCKSTFSYLPPFLIRFKRIYLPVMEAGIIKVIMKGISYLKAVNFEFEYDVSTLYRYTKYFLDRADKIYEQIKQIVLSLRPNIEYEKSIFEPRKFTKNREVESQDLLAQAIGLWEILKQILQNKLLDIDEIDTLTGFMYLNSI